MIVDANILIYATDSTSPHHPRASEWLSAALNGDERIGLPWQTLGAFARIITHPRVTSTPLTAEQTQDTIDSWLATEPAWIPPASDRTARAYSAIARRHHITGNLVLDAQLAALALEHGVPVISADSDFARFSEIRWINPLSVA